MEDSIELFRYFNVMCFRALEMINFSSIKSMRTLYQNCGGKGLGKKIKSIFFIKTHCVEPGSSLPSGSTGQNCLYLDDESVLTMSN